MADATVSVYDHAGRQGFDLNRDWIGSSIFFGGTGGVALPKTQRCGLHPADLVTELRGLPWIAE
jgi:hypothetical protein